MLMLARPCYMMMTATLHCDYFLPRTSLILAVLVQCGRNRSLDFSDEFVTIFYKSWWDAGLNIVVKK